MNIDLTLHPQDLKREFQTTRPNGSITATVNVNQVKFDMFTAAAQGEVIRIGRAVYWDGDMYNAILSPKKSDAQKPASQWSVSVADCEALELKLKTIFQTVFGDGLATNMWNSGNDKAIYALFNFAEMLINVPDYLWPTEQQHLRDDLREFLETCK